MISPYKNKMYDYFLLLIVAALPYGCGKSENEVDILVEDSYNQGYWDALECVKREGGSAYAAADDCEDE